MKFPSYIFLAKYFSSVKNAKMRNEITSFRQGDDESLFDAWEIFRELFKQCPHHGILICIKLEDILSRAGISSCKTCPTPVDIKSRMSSTHSVPYEDPSLYHSLTSALQYLTFTRSDISYAVQLIYLLMHNPMDTHMHETLHFTFVSLIYYFINLIYKCWLRWMSWY